MRKSSLLLVVLVWALILGQAAPVARADDLPEVGPWFEDAGPVLNEPSSTSPPSDNPYGFLDTPGAASFWLRKTTAPNTGITDRMWVQVMGGTAFSPIHGLGPSKKPSFDLAPLNVRLGLMIAQPCRSGPFRGVLEGIVEWSTWPVFNGYGNIVVGPAALLRYSYVQPEARLIPYIQAGAGIVYTDAYRDQTQDVIGQAQEFSLQAGIGLHYVLNQKWTLDAEADYLHISNAGLAHRNAGVNALGGTIGFTYYFRKRCR